MKEKADEGRKKKKEEERKEGDGGKEGLVLQINPALR